MEELTSKLGFDASKALDTLRELDGVLAKFEKTVGGTGSGLNLFNKQAGKTVGALKRIKSEADRAFASLDKLARARGAATGAASSTSGRTPRVSTEEVLDQIDNVKRKFGEIPAVAQTQHKRAFESAATKVAEYAARSGKSLGEVRRIQDNLGRSFTGAENKIADGLQRVEKSYGKLGETGTRSTKSLTISWETLARVVATQMIVRALSMVRNAINDAYNDSIDFQRQIAEIRTISPIKNLNALASTVRGLSDDFNQPLGDVSEGLYQTISNQIQGTANQVDVLSTSLKFSKVAVASTEDSVNLLTGTLNAFGKDASESEDVAAKFFKTIELGRTRASELAVSFGRTAPMAAQLGISLDELQASYAAVTIGGVKTAEAATQIRGAMTALVKPTTEMKKALRRLGYESGEQAVSALGFVGAMNAVISTTDGSTTSIAKLFPRVRGLNAVLRLTGTGAEAFEWSLTELEKTDLTELNDQFKSIMETDVEKVTKDLNKLKNFFTTELGTALVQTARDFFGVIGGVDTLIGVGKALVPVLGAGALALVAFAAKAAYASLRTKTLAKDASLANKAIGGFAAGLAMAGVAKSLGEGIGNWIVQQRRQYDKIRSEASREVMRKFSADEEERVKAVEQSSKKIQQIIQQQIAEQRKLHFQNVDAAREANETLVRDTKSTADAIIRVQEDRVRRYQQMEEDAIAAVTESQRRSISVRDRLSDDAFERNNRRLDNTKQLERYTKRAEKVAEYAAKMLAGAATTKETGDALAQFDRAAAFAKQAEAIANRTKNRQLEAKAAEAVRGVLQKQLVAEEQLRQSQQRRAQDAERAAAREKRNLDRLKVLSVRLQESASLFEDDKELPAAERAKRLKGYQEAFREFRRIALTSETLDVGQIISLTNLSRNLSRQLDSTQIKTLRAAPEALAGLNTQIEESTRDIQVKLRFLPDLEALSGEKLAGDIGRIGEAVQKQFERRNELVRQQAEARVAEQQLRQNFVRIRGNVSEPLDPVGFTETEFLGWLYSPERTKGLSDTQKGLTMLTEEMVRLNSSSDLTREKFIDLFNRARAFYEQNKGFIVGAEYDALGRNLGILQESLEVREKLKGNPFVEGGGEEKLREVQRFLYQVEQESKRAATSTGQVQINLSSATSPARSLAESSLAAANAMERMARASGQINMPNIPAVPTLTSAKGGLVQKLSAGGMVQVARHLSQGGFLPQGTDTVPAMLSPGEFVVNARSARRFFSQLVAINAGVRPVYRQEGGPVTNVGDIHVNVQGGQSARQSARTIAAGVRRELRRGTSTL